MADINNSINLNAGQAIAELNKLDKSLDQANASMNQFRVNAEGEIESIFDDVGKDAKKTQSALGRFFGFLGGKSKQAADDVKQISLSFADVARIVQSQIIFSALAELRQGFFEAADAAAEFQLQIARIDAVATDLDFGTARKAVEDLAVELGRPLQEVGEAVFEALQNDIAPTAEATIDLVRTQAQDLALITGGTLPQAVNALSSVFKSFDEDLRGTSDVAAQFFGVINAGRINLKDLESSLGTLSPFAKELGVDFVDMTNAIATVTLTGTKANVAATQLRNVFNKLLKPTEDLTTVFTELGVETFDQLVEKSEGDLVKALDAVVKKGNELGISQTKLFNTVRSNLGVLNLLTDNMKLYEQTTERAAEAAKNAREEIDKIDATAARDAARNASELEKIFTQIGDRALDLKNVVGDVFLSFVDSGDDAIELMVGLGGAVTAATVAVKLFGVSVKTAFPPLLAFTAAFVVFDTLTDILDGATDATEALKGSLDGIVVDQLRAVVDNLKDIDAAAVKAADEAFKSAASNLNTLTKAAGEAQKAIEAAFNPEFTQIGATTADALTQFGEGRRLILERIKSGIEEIDNAIVEGTNKIKDIRDELKNFTFEESLRNLSAQDALLKRQLRTAEQLAAAQFKAANVGLDEESQKTAKNLAAAALESAKAELSAAKRLGNENAIQAAVARVQEAYTAQINIERELNRLRGEESQAALSAQASILKGLNAEQQEALKEALKTRDEIIKASQEGAGDAAIGILQDKLQKELDAALDGLNEFDQTTLLEKFGLTDLAVSFSDRLRESLEATQINFTNTIDQLREQLATNDTLEATVKINAAIDEQAVGEALQKALDRARAEGGDAGEQLQNRGEAIQEVAKTQAQISRDIAISTAEVEASSREAFALLEKASKLELGVFGKDSPTGRDRARILTEPAIEALNQIGEKSAEELVELQNGLNKALTVAQEATTGILGDLFEARKQELVAGLTAAVKAVDAQLKVVTQRELFDAESLNSANALLEQLNADNSVVFDVDFSAVKEAETQFKNTDRAADAAAKAAANIGVLATQSVGGVQTLSNTTGGLKSQADAAAASFRQLLRDIQAAIDAAANAPSGPPSFHGGMQYRAAGGAPRGQDTISTMLSPGEFVTSARQTRNFLPELQAINSGNFTGGGSTGDTNITIGDINVNSSSQLPSQTAREVGNSIKRELRRKTFRL